MSEQEAAKWNIPYGVPYSKLMKIVRVLLQKKGDINKIPINVILPLSTLHKNFLSTNLSFLKSVNIIDGDNTDGYKLTELGKELADALSLEKEEDVKNCLSKLIEQSHLNDLKIYIETEKETITKDNILRFIKKSARVNDGSYAGNMPEKSSQGAQALMEIFNKAGIIANEISSASVERKISSTSKPKQSRKISQVKPESVDEFVDSSNDFTLNSTNFSIRISEKVNLEDLEFIKSQVLALFEHAKKKIENSKEE